MAAVLVKGYRPGKRDAIPPPLYLVSNTPPPYCLTCGRISRFHKTKSPATATKFCSEACKRRRPKAQDRAIEDVLWHLLSGEAIAGAAKERRVDDTRIWPGKGEKRVVVPTSLVEAVVFDVRDEHLDGATDGEDDDYDEEGLKVALRRFRGEEVPAVEAEGDVPVDKVDGEGDEQKRKGGQMRAARRENVKNACRRAVVFGLLPPGVEEAEQVEQETEEEWEDGPKRKGKKAKAKAAEAQATSSSTRRRCEALVRGAVVEPSFAKGDWGVRWADE